MHWSLEFYTALSLAEQQTWLDYDAERQRRITKMIELAQKPTNDDGSVSGEIVTARVLLALLGLG
jgi:hypothetical protein